MQREVARSAPAFEVREARPADAAGVTALLQGIYGEQDFFVGAAAAPASVLRSRLEHSRSEESLYLVATAAHLRTGADVVGWLELHRQGAVRMQHVATLTLAVERSARRGGIGRALLRRCYSWCLEVGVIKISLNVRASNEAAIGLYLSEGFEVEGRERLAVRLGPLSELAGSAGGGAGSAPDSRHGRTPGAAHDTAPGTARYEDNLVMARFVIAPSLD